MYGMGEALPALSFLKGSGRCLVMEDRRGGRIQEDTKNMARGTFGRIKGTGGDAARTTRVALWSSSNNQL